MKATPLILTAFRTPEALADLYLADWDLLLRQARRGGLLSSLHALLAERGLLDKVPEQPRRHLDWSHAVFERHALAVQWEVTQIRRALEQTGIPVILLKGAAYVMSGLPTARGRIFSDIDILVPKETVNQVEAALMMQGWATTHHDAYDQHYYRTWMHELPPMQHVRRMTVLDVHHAILPETAAIHPDSAKLIKAATKLTQPGDLAVLAPADMVLHAACHLFHEGELDNGLRDLLDIDSLLRHFGATPSFWHDLTGRAAELELTRPLFYALRYAARLLQTPLPQATTAGLAGPNAALLALMDMLYTRALLPDHPSCSDHLSAIARQLLYLRANWLRMPPVLLARHLFHKAFLSPDKLRESDFEKMRANEAEGRTISRKFRK
ncbi:MAG: nucleotidyltransferase family protein [Gallionella sp.]|nr:nucleotidyltransferase family protein [Gallionella sp.]MDD4945581.1 nucleotidyltransferase family protein [Gallionella sp.]